MKALPDVYDLAAVIESVVTPQHTCILVNTTHTLGVESQLEQRFPTNVVLSLVSGAEITQLGASEFEHVGSTEVWVGPANKNVAIPVAIQNDMAEALAMTLSTGQVDCKVSGNIRQQQFERMIGFAPPQICFLKLPQLTFNRPIAFHPASVLFETPSHAELIGKVGVRPMVSDVIDELLQLATAQGCSFSDDFKQRTLEAMVRPSETNSIMYQDFTAKRPMEVETYLGSPIKLAQEVSIRVPRIETLYSLLHHLNIINQARPRPPPSSPTVAAQPPPRLSSGPPRPPMHGQPNGNGTRGPRIPSGMGPPPHMRRGPPSMNGYPPRPIPNGFPPRSVSNQLPRQPSFEQNDLEEFSHLVLYDDIPEGGVAPNGAYADMSNGAGSSSSDIALRERELMLRQRELQLREQEYSMRQGGRRPPPARRGGFDDDDDDDDDFFDPMAVRGPPPPQIDPDNFDMMSVTSRRTRKAPSASQLRKNPEMGGATRQSQSFGGVRPGINRNRVSARMMQDVPGLHDSLMDNPLMAYSSNRYGGVDRKTMGDESRTNSLTAARLNELQGGGNMPGMSGAYPTPPAARRTSQPPPGAKGPMRSSPPHDGYMGPNGGPPNGRPSPPGMMRQPVPRYPPGQGNAVAPHQVEQHAGVSNLYPPKGPPSKNVRSLTGSASASAGSGDSAASAHIDSENSAHSSQSSLGPRPTIGVR